MKKIKCLLVLALGILLGANNFVNAGNVMKRVFEKGKIVVGVAPEYKPFEFKNDKGVIMGFDLDIAKKLAELLGVKLEVKEYKWNDLFSALDKNEVDVVISGLSRTLERAKKMNFTDPYFNTSQVILVTGKYKDTGKYEDMDKKGIKIGFVAKTTSEEAAKKHFKNTDFVPFDGELKATDALMKNQIDALVIDRPFAEFFTKKNSNINILLGDLRLERYCFAVAQGDCDFIYWLNYFIDELKTTGVFADLYTYWFIEQAWK